MIESVLCGVYQDKQYLAYADLYGNFFENDFIATSFARYLCPTLIDKFYWRNMSYQDARELIVECFRVIYSRFKLASDQVLIGFQTEDGYR